MTNYIIRRLLFGVVLILLSTVITFSILKISPGNPLAQITQNPRASLATIEETKRKFGLDQPAWQQYLRWLSGVVTGDFGPSISYDRPAIDVILERLPATLYLNLGTLFFVWAVALPLGIYAAVHQYKFSDKVLSTFSFAGMSLPGFYLALLLLWIFASKWHLLPFGGLKSLDHNAMSWPGQIWDYVHHLLLPIVVLTIGALAGLQRITRGNMLEVLRQQYITTARAKGLPENRVLYHHALRNAINPLITILGFEFAGLFSGAALLENVINYPGLGQLMLEAIRAQDQFVVMTNFLISASMLVLGNLLAEILLAFIDPRVSYE